MNYIKCPKCGKEEPAFDYAHVCGPIEVKRTVMNERIKQLAKEADIIFGHYNNNEVICSAIDIEKFAELIIHECAKVADLADENKCEWIGGNILTYFGVEE